MIFWQGSRGGVCNGALFRLEFRAMVGQRIFENNSSFRVKYRCGKGLIAIFRKIFASIDKNFIFLGGLGTGLSFCGV